MCIAIILGHHKNWYHQLYSETTTGRFQNPIVCYTISDFNNCRVPVGSLFVFHAACCLQRRVCRNSDDVLCMTFAIRFDWGIRLLRVIDTPFVAFDHNEEPHTATKVTPIA